MPEEITVANSKHTPYPLAWLLLPLAAAWIIPGLFGHEPWKPDEGYTIGLVKHVVDTGDWIVPNLTGQPFMEKPPVFYITAALLGRLLSPWLMPLHQAMALAAAFYMAATFLFTFLSGREIGGTRTGAAATLALMGCIGLVYRAHSAITDTALWAGFAVAVYGMLLAGRRLTAGAFWFGTGTGLAFMAKGLLGPGFIGLATLLLPIFCPEWRGRRFLALLALSLAFCLPWLIVWPLALYLESPGLFRQWFWNNNIGRFLGPRHGFRQLAQNRGHLKYLSSFPWFCLPLWPPAIMVFAQNGRRALRDPFIVFPALVFLVGFSVLSVASGQRDLYLIPLLAPLALLAARGLGDLPAWLNRAFRVVPAAVAAVLLAGLWGVWLVWRLGLSQTLDGAFESYAPGFREHAGAAAVLAAALYTAVWALMLFADGRFRREWDWVWALCLTAIWGTAMLLYLPVIDHVKGYHPTFAAMAAHLPAGQPVRIDSYRLGESQRAVLDYYFGIQTRRIGRTPEEREGDYFLVQDILKDADRQLVPEAERWEPVWEGTRPGDIGEWYVLYRRLPETGQTDRQQPLAQMGE